MEIKAKTTYNYEVYRDFQRFNIFKGKNSANGKVWILIISFVGIAVSIFNLIAFGSDSIVWLMMAIIILADLLFGYMYFIVPKIQYKSAKKFADIENNYIFKDDELSTTSNNAQYNGSSTMKYEMIFKVYESKDYFFIYINKMQAYIVDKSQIIDGTAEEIRAAILKYLPPKKYIVCKR